MSSFHLDEKHYNHNHIPHVHTRKTDVTNIKKSIQQKISTDQKISESELMESLRKFQTCCNKCDCERIAFVNNINHQIESLSAQNIIECLKIFSTDSGRNEFVKIIESYFEVLSSNDIIECMTIFKKDRARNNFIKIFGPMYSLSAIDVVEFLETFRTDRGRNNFVKKFCEHIDKMSIDDVVDCIRTYSTDNGIHTFMHILRDNILITINNSDLEIINNYYPCEYKYFCFLLDEHDRKINSKKNNDRKINDRKINDRKVNGRKINDEKVSVGNVYDIKTNDKVFIDKKINCEKTCNNSLVKNSEHKPKSRIGFFVSELISTIAIIISSSLMYYRLFADPVNVV
jgi:hypothetical protein